MSKYDDTNTLLNDLDGATTNLGTYVQSLIDDINRTATDGLNGPQTEAVLGRLSALKTNLTALASNSSNPVPPAPPAPPAMPGPFA